MWYKVLPDEKNDFPLRIVWIHGWGGSSDGMLYMTDYFSSVAECVPVDLDGFGRLSLMEKVMRPEDYADELAEILSKLPPKKTVVVGFSYGARVAVHLAIKHPNMVDGVVFLAGAGLKAKRSCYFKMKAGLFKFGGKLICKFNWLKFLKKIPVGSRDYKNASPIMKQTLIIAVNEDLSFKVKSLACSCLLLYGSKDEETPSYFGKTYKELIPKAEFFEIQNVSHLGILTSPIAKNLIEDFILKRIQ